MMADEFPSRSDATIVAVGFNPREMSPQVQRASRSDARKSVKRRYATNLLFRFANRGLKPTATFILSLRDVEPAT